MFVLEFGLEMIVWNWRIENNMVDNKDELTFEEYIDTQLYIKSLTEEQTDNLILRARAGDKEAEDILCRYHGRFVRKMAREFARNGISFEDLFQEGMIGLTDGIRLYDETRDNKFMTFAYYHIYRRMMEFTVNNNKNIRVPRHMYEIIVKYNKMLKLIEIGSLPEMTEIEQAHYLDCSLSRLDEIKKAALSEVSIYNKTSDEEGNGLIDTFEAPSEYQPENVVQYEWLKGQLITMISDLTDKEANVIKLKFGLEDGVEHKDVEIADKLGVSKQAINSLYQRGLKKLRKYCLINNIKMEDLIV